MKNKILISAKARSSFKFAIAFLVMSTFLPMHTNDTWQSHEPKVLASHCLEARGLETSSSIEFLTHQLPVHVDSMVGVQIPLRAALLNESGFGFEVDTRNSCLFGALSPTVRILETADPDWKLVRFMLPIGSVSNGRGTVLTLDFSNLFPEGASLEELFEQIQDGNGNIVVLDDLM